MRSHDEHGEGRSTPERPMIADDAGKSSPLVVTARGALLGVHLPGDVIAFKGIRYAEPPTGDRRWRAPVPANSWRGVRSAEHFGPACVQPSSPPGSIYAQDPPQMSEDCLFLNIWAPRRTSGAAVMVWLHGGALRRGNPAGGLQDGSELARRGVIVVSLNYRLGVLGYLAHPELTAESTHGSSGNYGLLDQIEGLRWVLENIASFGGDPGNVTLFGESAGALSAIELMASPLARGLFHKVILQSGYLMSNMELGRTRFGVPAAEVQGAQLSARVGAPRLATLRAMNVERLVEEFEAAGFDPQATIDGWVLPRQIVECLDWGEQAPVPMIVGFNEGEIRSLRYFLPPLPRSPEEYEAAVRDIYRDLALRYLEFYPATDIEQSALAAARDAHYGWSAVRLARAQSRLGLPTYLYYFAHHYPAQRALGLEAFHASELPYVFGRIGVPEGWPKKWPRPPNDARERGLSEAIMGYFTSFARSGVPKAAGEAAWSQYGDEGAYLEIREVPRLATKLLPGVFELHEEVIARRRSAGTQHWYINVGLASPSVPDAESVN